MPHILITQMPLIQESLSQSQGQSFFEMQRCLVISFLFFLSIFNMWLKRWERILCGLVQTGKKKRAGLLIR